MKNCSDEQRALLHSAVGLVSAALAKSNLPANALAAGVNELVVQALMNPKGKYYEHFKKHPEQLQWLSAFVGSVVSSAAGGNVGAGASTAASGTKNNMLEKIPLVGPFVKEVVKKAPVGFDKDGTCYGKLFSIGGGELVSGAINIISTGDMVFEGGQLTGNLSALPFDYSVMEIRMYKAKGDSYAVDYWVKDWKEFNREIPGFSPTISGAIGASGTFSMTKNGYVLVYVGVTSNAGFSAGGGIMSDGINKNEYVR